MYAEHDLPEGEGGLNWDENKVDRFFQVVDSLVGNGTCVSTKTHPDGLELGLSVRAENEKTTNNNVLMLI